MHRITSAYLKHFANGFGLEQYREDEQFERFVNYVIVKSKTGIDFDLDNFTTGQSDDGTDGVGVLINEELIVSHADASLIFNSGRKSHDVEVIFIQAKTSKSFNLGDFLKFKESVIKFIESENYKVKDDTQKNAHSVFDASMSNVSKIRDGKLILTVRFVTTGVYESPDELEDAKNEFIKKLEDLGYFSKIDINFVGRDELNSLWVSTHAGVEATLSMFSWAALPPIDGIDEAYLVIVNAKEFVSNLLVTNDDTMHVHVFEDNVRAFLGIDNDVNKSMSETLMRTVSATRFPVLNNGITIVSPNVRVQGNTLYLEDFQIVNGCQTSNVLYQNKDILEDIMVSLKVVETQNEEVFADLVKATNSQTEVKETQFYSLRPISKKIEDYFNTYDGKDERIYFERRHRQYIGKEVPAIRTFSLTVAMQCVTSLFMKKPEIACRYPKLMYDTYANTILCNKTKEIAFYASCLILYKVRLYVASAKIPQNMSKYKWHILLLVAMHISGDKFPKLNSKEIERYCNKIIKTLLKPNKTALKPFKEAVKIINSLNVVDIGELKTQRFTTQILKKFKSN